MAKSYNQIAAESLERLCALSDGIFAFAMTLLVLDLHVPSSLEIHDSGEFFGALASLLPRVIPWIMSFFTLGIFWVGQQTQLNHLQKSTRHFAWIHLGFLAFVTAVPFSTSLLAQFISFRAALLIYWMNIFFLGMTLLASWTYACRAGLLRKKVTAHIYDAMRRRILVAQAFYAFGATLCWWNPNWSIGFIMAVQLNYVIAPRFTSRLTA